MHYVIVTLLLIMILVMLYQRKQTPQELLASKALKKVTLVRKQLERLEQSAKQITILKDEMTEIESQLEEEKNK